MHYYRERLIDEAIPKDGTVSFDYLIDESTSLGALGEYQDFEYDNDGYIDIKTPGYYMVKWTTTSQTGFFQDGSWFELKYYDEEVQEWKPIGNGRDVHELETMIEKKADACSGITAFEVTVDHFETWGRFRIGLFNVSGSSIYLSKLTSAKASLVIYGVAYFGFVLNELWKLLDDYEQECCGLDLIDLLNDLQLVENYQNELLDQFEFFQSCFDDQMNWFFVPEAEGGTYSGTYPPVNFTTSNPNNYEMRITRVGFIYTFQLRASDFTVNQNPPGTPNPSGNQSKKYFVYGGTNSLFANFSEAGSPFFVPLSFAEGGASGTGQGVMAAWIDNSGIYLLGTYPPGNTPGCSFSFSLIFRGLKYGSPCSLPSL